MTSDADAAARGSVGAGSVDARLETRERRMDSAIDRIIPYLGLTIGSMLTPFTIPSASPVLWVPVAAATALWSYLFSTRRPTTAGCHALPVARAADPRWGAVYIAGLLVSMAVLVTQSGWFGFQAIAGYASSIEFLRGGWRWIGVGVTAAVAAYAQLGSPALAVLLAGLGPWAALAAANAAMGGGFTYYGSLTAMQAHRRREIIAELNEANRRLSETLEENAGLHVQLLSQAREAGVLDERARMAREIHDTLAQGLTGIVTQLEAADAADGVAEVRRRHIDTARALARESLTEARRSVEALAPGRLADAQLPDAITDMAKSWAQTSGVDVVVDTTGDPRPLMPEIEVTLFRVAQEALANVGKHARADRVGITLSYMDDVVVLDVRDDGVGFRPAELSGPSRGGGFGLPGMEQRVRRMSGTFAVESAPGEGTALSASAPAIPAELST